MSGKEYRDAFENAIYKDYKTSEYAKFAAGRLEEFKLISKQDFFTMKKDGTYALDPVNFAFSGWNNAINYILSTPIDESVAAVDHLIG